MTTTKILEPSTLDKIRFYDCDPFGHLNNSRYLDYIMNAREIHLSSFYGFNLDEFYRKGIGWVVSNHEIVYLKPARFNEIVSIQTSLFGATDTILMVEGIMFDEFQSSIKAVLWTKFTSINLSTGKKQPHPEEIATFAAEILNPNIDGSAGLTKRVQHLFGTMINK